MSGAHVVAPPDGWEVVQRLNGVQFVGSGVEPGDDGEAVPLGAGDVPEILDLVERTRPGPFRSRTVEFGGYLGVRRGGGWSRWPALACTCPGGPRSVPCVPTDAHRGQGLAGRLVRAVATQILARGERPFLHSAAENASAVRLYTALGFELRCETPFMVLRVPPAGDRTFADGRPTY